MHPCILLLSILVSGLFVLTITILSKHFNEQDNSWLINWLSGKDAAVRNRQLGLAILLLGVVANFAIKGLAALDSDQYVWGYDFQRDIWTAFSTALGAVFISNGYSVNKKPHREGNEE